MVFLNGAMSSVSDKSETIYKRTITDKKQNKIRPTYFMGVPKVPMNSLGNWLMVEELNSVRWSKWWRRGWAVSRSRDATALRSRVSSGASFSLLLLLIIIIIIIIIIEWVIHRFLFGPGPQDRVCFRRQPRDQFSFPAHRSQLSALRFKRLPHNSFCSGDHFSFSFYF